MNVESNIKDWSSDKYESNDLSFDFCFNYFQGFYKEGRLNELISAQQLEMSCLQLGFYLASWGMFRGSSKLPDHNARYLRPIIELIVRAHSQLWKIDADDYSSSNIELIMDFWKQLKEACPEITMTDTLASKIMLGVFGCVPAFDTIFKAGCDHENISHEFAEISLQKLGDFYKDNCVLIEQYRIPTASFSPGLAAPHSSRKPSRAKIIDMAFFMEGKLALASIQA
jgi:hypothetical protein